MPLGVASTILPSLALIAAPALAAPPFGSVEIEVGSRPAYSAIADVDGDGDLDAAVSLGDPHAIRILNNDGNGVLSPAAVIALAGEPRRVAFGDVDGDGSVDLAVAEFHSEVVEIFFNDGGGTFSSPATNLALAGSGHAVALGDLDRDGDLDVVAPSVEFPAPAHVFFNDGTGAFPTSNEVVPNAAEDSVWLVFNRAATPLDVDLDLDLDGLSDVAESVLGTDPADFDTDDDGLADSVDPSIVIDAIERLPPNAFLPQAPFRTRLIDRILLAQDHALVGARLPAVNVLSSAASKLDGCIGATGTPDPNDWIVDCRKQIQIQLPMSLVLDNLASPPFDPQEPF